MSHRPFRIQSLGIPLLLALPLLCCAAGPGSRPTDAELQSRLDAVKSQLPALKASLDRLAKASDIAYPLVSYTVLENFARLAQEDIGRPVGLGWVWKAVNGNDSGSELQSKTVHSGNHAMRLFNRTPEAPNVYGMLEYGGVIHVKAGVPYTFSAFVNTGADSTGLFAFGNGWQFRLTVPNTRGQWQRVHLTFTPGEADRALQPRFITSAVAEAIYVDDVELVEGDAPGAGKNLLNNPDFEYTWTAARATNEIAELEDIASRLAKELKDAEARTLRLPNVPRWTGTERPQIVGPSFVAPTATTEPSGSAAGLAERRPLFFVGYGHFAEARDTIERFPACGANIIQGGEWGPSAIFPAEGKTSDEWIRTTADALDRGAKAGVAYDLLISPHYFPQWMIDKYPSLRHPRVNGFIGYSIYAPELRQFFRDYCRTILPPLKDKPALLSVCLTNEPMNLEAPGEHSDAAWRAWLQKKHTDVATLNKRWSTNYAKFEEIPQPNPIGPSAEKRPGPVWADWVRFNQESFAAFHQMLADCVHEVAPELPVHAKATTWHNWRAENVANGVDATLFGSFSNILGNDSVGLYAPDSERWDDPPAERGGKDFQHGWIEEALGYDLQRATKDAPVFNSENHPTFDRDIRPVPGRHFRASLWMGAIHGQSATTLWVWGRSYDPASDLAGNVMDRPACVEATGRTCLDLNRLAFEVTALQNAKPDVALLQSTTGLTWDGAAHDKALSRAYTALSFTGLRPGFVTERQLEAGQLPATKVLLVPNVRHLSDAAVGTLRNYKGKLVFVGDDTLLSANEYGQPRVEPVKAADVIPFDPAKTRWRDLLAAIAPKLGSWSLASRVKLDAPPGSIVWTSVDAPEGTLVNLYNPGRETVRFHVASDRERLDLIAGKRSPAGEEIVLRPMEFSLVRLGK